MTEQDWWASAEGRSTCHMCGEQSPGVQEVADARGVQNFCQVCAHSWWVTGPLSLAQYQAITPKAVPKVGTIVPVPITKPRVTDVSGHMIEGDY